MSARAAWRLEALRFAPVYDFAAGKMGWAANGLPTEGKLANDEPRAGWLNRKDVLTCRLDERLGKLREDLWASGQDTCIIVNDQGVVLGRIKLDKVEGASDDATLEDVMEPGPSTYRPNVTLQELAEKMRRENLEDALITTAKGQVIGILYHRDIEHTAPAQSGRNKSTAKNSARA